MIKRENIFCSEDSTCSIEILVVDRAWSIAMKSNRIIIIFRNSDAKAQVRELAGRKRNLNGGLWREHSSRTPRSTLPTTQPLLSEPTGIPSTSLSSTPTPSLPRPSSPSHHRPATTNHNVHGPSFRMNTYNYPTTISCPNCRSTVLTVVNLESGNTTYLWCTFLGCCVSPLLCCIPFLMESCLDKSHYCPHCGHNILRKHQKCFEFMGCWLEQPHSFAYRYSNKIWY